MLGGGVDATAPQRGPPLGAPPRSPANPSSPLPPGVNRAFGRTRLWPMPAAVVRSQCAWALRFRGAWAAWREPG